MKITVLCAVVVLFVLDSNLTSGRHVEDIAAVPRDDVIDDLSVEHERRALEDYILSEAAENVSSSLNHKLLSREKRKAIKYAYRRWTNNEIPFEIDYSQFMNNHIYEIFKAMNDYQQYTCLRFKPRSTQDRNVVKIVNKKGCTSSIGMSGGQQEIDLEKDGCMSKPVIVHEIGHAVGFFHEQQRPDRDRFVTILLENADDKFLNVFAKSDEIDTYGVPYDYRSIMHYHYKGFSKNDQITIKTKDPSYQYIIGTASGLSYYDIKLANLMYKCGQKCDPSIRCPNNGFLGKDCKCRCPGNPIEMCDGSGPVVVRDPLPPTKQLCQKLSWSCYSWKTSGECSDSKAYCPMYCDYCGRLLGRYQPFGMNQ